MGQSENGTLKLSTGVVLHIQDVAIAAFGAVKTQMYAQRPKVPEVWIESKDRSEPNPNDPDYIAALEDWNERTSIRMLDAAIILGTYHETLPEGFPEPQSKAWASTFATIGIDIPKDGPERYLAWVRYRAAPTAEDISEILLATSRQAGVTEEDAADAAATFRDSAQRGPNRATPDSP